MLTLPEELLLLRAAVGAVQQRPTSDFLAFANRPLAAARLIELVLAKRVAVEFRRRHLLWSDAVVLLDATPTRDPLLDEVLERVAGSGARSCSYWIKRTAKGAQAAYWDRVVSGALLRPDRLTYREPQRAVDAQTLAAVTERIRWALDHPERADLRDVALVTLVVNTQMLFPLLHGTARRPVGLLRVRAERRDDRLAQDALDTYKRSLEARPDLADADRRRATMAVDGIARLADIVDESQGGGG